MPKLLFPAGGGTGPGSGGSGSRIPVRVATTGNIASFAGGAPLVVDGRSLVAGDRVLAWRQTAGAENGPYTVVTPGTGADGTWERTSDYSSDEQAGATATIYVQEGDVYADREFKQTTNPPITLGTTAIVFTLANLGDAGSVAPARVAAIANVADPLAAAPSVVDGIAVAAGDRVLLPVQAAAETNGLYIVIVPGTGADGVWRRAWDLSTSEQADQFGSIYIQEGTWADRHFKLATNPPITLDTTGLTFEIQSVEALATIPAGNSLVAGPLGSKTVVDSTVDGGALLGTDGTPSAGNRYVTSSDPRLVSTGGGDVVGIGPAPVVDGNVAVYDGTTGKIIRDGPPESRLALATETNQGTAEIATQAETDAGVLDDKIVTPLKLKTSLGSAVKTIRFAVAGAGGAKTVDSTISISAGAIILDCKVKILTPFDTASPTLAIGEAGGTPDLLQTTGENVPTAVGLYSTPQDTVWGPAAAVRATLTGTTTVGSAIVTVEYAPTPDP